MSALQNEIDKLNTLKESFHELSKKVLDTQAVLTELNNGKQEMVDALAIKNVQSSADKTLSAIADDVRSIAQSPIIIDGGEMYEKQLFGAATDKTNPYEQPDSPMWNLYQVMANLLSDGRFVTYGGILLGEFPKGNDTIQLNNAGAGGAYLTSDGVFYDIDTTHTWNDAMDGHVNRWVAYLFASDDKEFAITDASLCPDVIFIGRKVSKLSCSIIGKIQDIIVIEGSELGSVNISGEQEWNSNVVINNIKKHNEGEDLLVNPIGVVSLYLDIKEINSAVIQGTTTKLRSVVCTASVIDFTSLVVYSKNCTPFGENAEYYSFPHLEQAIWRYKFSSNNTYLVKSKKAKQIDFPKLKRLSLFNGESYSWYPISISNKGCECYLNALEGIDFGYYFHNSPIGVGSYGKFYMENLKHADHLTGNNSNNTSNIEYIHIGAKGDKTNIIAIGRKVVAAPNCFDIEIGDKANIDKGLAPRWYPCQNIDINGFNSVTEENMINHILKRLKQDEEMCGSGVTITLGSTNLAKLTSEEAVALLDSLTNTYGYTFA